MNKIGFKNFRRFPEFPPLEYDGITFLVGRNNAGKSTMVKALLLIDNYFKSDNIQIFSFGNKVLEDANIVTFGRARNLSSGERYIYFTQKIEDYVIEITVAGEDDKSFALISSLTITDTRRKLNFIFNMEARSLKIVKEREDQPDEAQQAIIHDLNTQIEEISNQLSTLELSKTSKEYIELVSKLDSLEKKLDDIRQDDSDSPEANNIFSLEEEFEHAHSLMEIVDRFLSHVSAQHDREFRAVQDGEPESERFKDLRALKELGLNFVGDSFGQFETLMKNFSVAYMGAVPAKQSALFAIRDKNNALAQAIHEFSQLNILPGEEEHRFLLKWMETFEIGTNFEINMHAGEAYEMKIRSNTRDIQLADKGMGSIQAMLLIIRIACVIRKKRLYENDPPNHRLVRNTTVIIEEPELNLHPALQSKLADLFLEVNLAFQLDFIIETHSEYIIRRSQVLVAEQEFAVAPNDNPFFVYYFPKEAAQPPYRLNYTANGRFDKNFGEGFFDEATNNTMNLLKIERANQ